MAWRFSLFSLLLAVSLMAVVLKAHKSYSDAQAINWLIIHGAHIQREPDGTVRIALPDEINPENAVMNLEHLHGIESIHFFRGSSPPGSGPQFRWYETRGRRDGIY